jgi:hypothetical protein
VTFLRRPELVEQACQRLRHFVAGAAPGEVPGAAQGTAQGAPSGVAAGAGSSSDVRARLLVGEGRERDSLDVHVVLMWWWSGVILGISMPIVRKPKSGKER